MKLTYIMCSLDQSFYLIHYNIIIFLTLHIYSVSRIFKYKTIFKKYNISFLLINIRIYYVLDIMYNKTI